MPHGGGRARAEQLATLQGLVHDKLVSAEMEALLAVFDLDVLACLRCGGRLRVIATIQDPVAARTILTHLGPSGVAEPPGPAPPAPIAIGSPRHSPPHSTLAGAPLRPHGRSLTARR